MIRGECLNDFQDEVIQDNFGDFGHLNLTYQEEEESRLKAQTKGIDGDVIVDEPLLQQPDQACLDQNLNP